MQDFLKRLKYPALTFILSLTVLFYFFHVVLLAPNDYLFAPGGDGIKNYYAFMFHARYEPSFWEFNGMNYPYYVHIVYADAHPLFSWIIGRLGLYEYGVGILNTVMLLSYPICSVFLYKIFKHYKVEVLWAIVAAIGITYLAPQLGRLTGHLSMAYVFAVPAMWWLLIKCNGDNKIRWSVITALYLLAFFFTHPYLGIILAFLSLFYWLVYFVYDRSKWKVVLSSMSLQVFVPFIIFQSAIILTDTHVDRIDAPGGFYNLHAGWSSILAAHHGPMNNLTHLLQIRFMTWESWAYVGFSTIIFSLIVGAYAVIKRKTLAFKEIFRHELFLFVIAAWIILVFSFCFPFKFTWMRWVTDYIGPLKQFRVLGRFTWIFFYVITTATVIAYYRVYLKEGRKFGLALVFYLGAAFYFVESHDVTMGVSEIISTQNNSFKKEYLRDDMAGLVDYVDENEYDAIILLPFMHLSSENIMILGEEQAGFDSYILSYHTGLPLLNSLSSRMSQSEAILFNNFFSPEFIEKELVYELPVGDKIVLVLNDDYLNVDEQRITFTQEKDFVNNTFIAYEFDRDKWNTDYYFNEVLDWQKLAIHDVGSGWMSDDSAAWYIYQPWDETKAINMKGGGAFTKEKEHYDILIELDADDLEKTEYTVSFWYNHVVDRADISAITEFTYKNGDEAEWVSRDDIKQTNLIVGDWAHVEMNFTVDDTTESVRVIMAGNNTKKTYVIDELFMYKTNGAKFFNTGEVDKEKYIIYNNYWIKKNSFKNH